jgi:protoporphyrinogen oxidase
MPVTVLEQDREYVGGLSRTIDYKGFLFDVGGHRFFSKNEEIERFWTHVLGDRMLRRKRLSRIYYDGRFFKYPLDPLDALAGLGPVETVACLLSFARARCAPAAAVRSFEDWVVRAFGRRLYEIFFRTYTEKVWGIPCSDISADWAAQRIKGLSLPALIRAALGLSANGNGAVIKTLVDEFRYPPRGPGELWNEVAALVRRAGGHVLLGERAVALRRERGRAVDVQAHGAAGERTFAADHFVSTLPIRDLVQALDPPAPAEVVAAAEALRYRDFLMVAIVLERAEVFPDQWIYIHDPRVAVGRIQNFKNWSPGMVPDPRHTLLGLEYFCSEGDPLWAASDAALLERAERELSVLGFLNGAGAADGTVVRQRKAYPVYDHDYRANVARVRRFIQSEIPNLQLAGRNGMHKYDNQDHAMMTGLIAARNILGAGADAWRVNTDAQYLEAESEEAGVRLVPLPAVSPAARRLPG